MAGDQFSGRTFDCDFSIRADFKGAPGCPDALIEWRDVWTGAFLTSVLFSLGKFLLALYLGREGAASAPGAAGALILILSWVFYTSNIVLFGAEFTQVWARHRGRDIRPTDKAYRVEAPSKAPALDQKLT